MHTKCFPCSIEEAAKSWIWCICRRRAFNYKQHYELHMQRVQQHYVPLILGKEEAGPSNRSAFLETQEREAAAALVEIADQAI